MADHGRYNEMRVLVAEDNLGNQRLIATLLQSLGVEALIVADGQAAVAEFAKDDFDLVISDIAMPVMDGLTAVRQIRDIEKREKRVRAAIYMLSSQHSLRDLRASKAAGANGHLAKPMTVSMFLHAVEDGLRRARSHGGRQYAPAASVFQDLAA